MKPIQNILYPVDFSPHALVALPYMLDLVEKYKATAHVLHVVDDTYQYFTAGADDIFTLPIAVDDQLTGARRKMDQFAAEHFAGLPHTITQVTSGKPYLEIVRYANDQNIDLIVMATHGHGALTSILLGTVAEKVVRKAPCPVLTIRHPEYKFKIDSLNKGQDI